MKIEKSIYEGYVWYSDSTMPQIINNEEFQLEIADNSNPFIIEAQLFDHSNKQSFNVKYVDGKHYIKTYILSDSEVNQKADIRIYIGNRMENKKLRFLQRWEKKQDPLCENMETYYPTELIFIGFESSKK